MDPVQKALWYVESHSRRPIKLDEVAGAAGVSPHHLTRAFAAVTGVPLMRYVRRRRLSEAAKQLADGAIGILSVALEYGYGSHEAFSRAFKEEFRLTPERVREQGHVGTLELTEPIAMNKTPMTDLRPPRIETLPRMRLAGLVERYDEASIGGIPDQWQRFVPYIGAIDGQAGRDSYGVCYNEDDGKFDYIAGVAIEESSTVPFGLVQLDLPEQKYAVFGHGGHISEIRAVMSAIWSHGLSAAGLEAAMGPTLERYGEQFDGVTGLGGFEIWIAVK